MAHRFIYTCITTNGKRLGEYVETSDKVTFEPSVVTDIYEVAPASLKIAQRHQLPVFVTFNGITLNVPYETWPNTKTNVQDVIDAYYRKMEQKMM